MPGAGDSGNQGLIGIAVVGGTADDQFAVPPTTADDIGLSDHRVGPTLILFDAKPLGQGSSIHDDAEMVFAHLDAADQRPQGRDEVARTSGLADCVTERCCALQHITKRWRGFAGLAQPIEDTCRIG